MGKLEKKYNKPRDLRSYLEKKKRINKRLKEEEKIYREKQVFLRVLGFMLAIITFIGVASLVTYAIKVIWNN